ncbi:P-loop containing nucleoside triphosphate hydrolase protein [Sistotremastrum niveocremeum HHB9708]|uniref:p-loop containing nucleoside triphosphate hydrolase protein n=2 Tax=Sistotremastraceae TaxID=3402574 RepID=A0A164Z5H2_9AGAM|nr:P-loop containing nucleoside triphosphate hydrolase protein [Sistotremastrum niveocremeum HHB9708]KZT37669.1 P-loop containing nucleoside triphosphate hydrolase protein [Sistotremastrum suecicum HHB10207 ss-3]
MAAAIDIQGLSYAHDQHANSANYSLRNVELQLPRGSRTVLIGANGAGKSTLLQILAGKRLVNSSKVLIFDRDVFRDSPPGVTFLGTEWAMNPVVRGDIVVSHFLDSVGGYRHKERRDKLLDILDVDLDWHMHQISDGERRRVQLCMGLMAPWDLLLLDEVTVDLDVLVRDHLLNFLIDESEQRGATILYATHIFDGLNAFPTHIAHMRDGTFVIPPVAWPSILETAPTAKTALPGSSLHAIALNWLKEDREIRRNEERAGKRVQTRGARKNGVTSDSEIFYKKYDYSH